MCPSIWEIGITGWVRWSLLGGHDLLLVEAGVGQTGVCVMVNISFWLTGGSWQPKILVAFY